MTDIGFYHLTVSPLEWALPKLLEKILSSQMRAVVLAGDEEQVEMLNRHLWLYDPNSFLPHGSVKDGHKEQQPVYLATELENPNEAQVLVVLDGSEPDVTGFSRVVDMFNGQDNDAVAAARVRWKTYKDRDQSLTYWQQNDRGGWQKAA